MPPELVARAAALGLEIRRSQVPGQYLLVDTAHGWVLMNGHGLRDEEDVAHLLASRGAL